VIGLDWAVIANGVANACTALAVAYTAKILKQILQQLRQARDLERTRKTYYGEDAPRKP
jgi:hypothetical protein